MIEKRVDKRSEQVWRTRRESAGSDLIDRLPQFGIRLVNSTRMVSLPPQGRYLFGGETKQKTEFCLAHPPFRASHRSGNRCAVERRYGRAAFCCSARIAWNIASSMSTSSLQRAASMNGFRLLVRSFAYF